MRLNALILVACLCSPIFAADSSDKQIDDLIQRYDAAWLKKDVVAVDPVLAPQYIYFTSEGKINHRRSTFDFLQKASYKLDRSERTEIEIHRTFDRSSQQPL